jgi:hypothetical protein
MDWEQAKKHFDSVRKEYEDLEGVKGVNTTLALRMVFDQIAIRFNQGERSEKLYNEMIEIK